MEKPIYLEALLRAKWIINNQGIKSLDEYIESIQEKLIETAAVIPAQETR